MCRFFPLRADLILKGSEIIKGICNFGKLFFFVEMADNHAGRPIHLKG